MCELVSDTVNFHDPRKLVFCLRCTRACTRRSSNWSQKCNVTRSHLPPVLTQSRVQVERQVRLLLRARHRLHPLRSHRKPTTMRRCRTVLPLLRNRHIRLLHLSNTRLLDHGTLHHHSRSTRQDRATDNRHRVAMQRQSRDMSLHSLPIRSSWRQHLPHSSNSSSRRLGSTPHNSSWSLSLSMSTHMPDTWLSRVSCSGSSMLSLEPSPSR